MIFQPLNFQLFTIDFTYFLFIRKEEYKKIRNMKLTKMILWFLIGLGSSIGLLTLIWERLSYLIAVSIGICSVAIPLQIILYIQTRTKKERPILSIFLIMFIICFIFFLYTIERDTSDFIRWTAIAAWVTSYVATITLIINKPLNVYKEL